MIENTFLFLPKIGYGTEKRLWLDGIKHWDDFLQNRTIPRISSERKGFYDAEIARAQSSMGRKDISYFNTTLPRREHWRLYEAFKDDALFLDIETTGLSFNCDITAITFHDSRKTDTLILGKNLSRSQILERMKRASLLVTFYGTAFDLPFIENKFGIRFTQPHIDLCFLARRVGLRGGLKAIERVMGIRRETEGIDGFEAVRLWRRYVHGDCEALQTLIKYNREDTQNLCPIASKLFSEMKKKIFYSL